MATFVNFLRLTELATGEGSGTWGTTTNQSLELIGEALGYATQQAFGSDADATTTVADGASDPARAMYYKITSAASLTATRTLTIAPNTISRVMFIENATSGSQSIAISQGSGASVTIATGKTAVVYLDGAGATAAVVDAMAGVDPGVTDTLTEVLVAGNTSGGTNIELSTTDKVQFRDAAIYINSSVDGQLDIVADTEIQIAATTVDLNGNLDVSGTALVTGVLTTTAATVFNGGFASNADSTLGTDKKVQFRDSAIYINSSVDGQLDIVADTEIQIAATTIDINGTLAFDSLKGTGATTVTNILDEDNMASDSATAIATQQSIKAYVDSQVGTVDTLSEILANGNTTGSTDIAVDSAQKVQFRDAAIYINSSVDGQLDIVADTEIQIAATTIDINGAINASGEIIAASLDISGDVDVDGTTNLDVVDIDGAVDMASTLTVGSTISINEPTQTTYGLVSKVKSVYLSSTDATYANLTIRKEAATSTDYLQIRDSGNALLANLTSLGGLITAPTAGGHTIFNEGGVDADFRVESSGNANMLFVDASANKVGIGTATPSGMLTVLNDNATRAYSDRVRTEWNSIFGATENTHYQRFKLTADSIRVSSYVKITVSPQSAGGIGSMNGATLEGNIWRADGGVAFDLISITNGLGGGGSIALSEPVASGNDVIFGISVSNNGTATTYDVACKVELIGSTDGGFTYAEIAGTTSHTGTNPGSGSFTYSSGSLLLGLKSTEAVFNEDGDDRDFRVESDTNANALFVDGASGVLCIGSASTGSALGVILKRGLDTNFFEADDGTKKMIVGTDSTNTFVKLGSLSSHPASIIAGNVEIIQCAVAGEVTMPLQPAFQVRPASLQSNIAVDTAVTIVLGTEAFDVGSNFASNTFTAPVTGKYQFNVELRLDNIDTAAGYYHLNLTTSNRTYFSIVDPGVLASDPAYWSLGLSVLADMDASDTAYVVIYQAGGTAQTDINNDVGNTLFSGYLAC
jgi:cytoskeletal protein CcmA (bactofilin family)